MRDRDRYKQERREWRERQRERRREWRYRCDDWRDGDGWRYHRHWHKLGHGVSLLIIGCVLIGVGLSLGGRWNAIPWWPWTTDSHGNVNWSDGDTGKGAAGAGKLEDRSGAVSATVKSIDISLKAASLVIRSGNSSGSGTYAAKGFGNGALHISSDNGSLKIDEGEWEHLIDFGNGAAKPVVEIELPAGVALESCSVHLGAGSLKGKSIAAKNAFFETGAGSIDLDGCSFEETKVATGAGRFAFSGSLGKRTEIAAGAGSVEMSVKGRKDDFRIDYSRGVGSVRVDGESFTGMGNGTAGNGNADRRIKVSSGVGSVRIDFTE